MEKVELLEHPERVAECNSRIEAIKNAYEVIEKANIAGFLSDERIEELKSFADIKVKNADGEEIPLLDEKEVEAITVRKGTLTDSFMSLSYIYAYELPLTSSYALRSASHNALSYESPAGYRLWHNSS